MLPHPASTKAATNSFLPMIQMMEPDGSSTEGQSGPSFPQLRSNGQLALTLGNSKPLTVHRSRVTALQIVMSVYLTVPFLSLSLSPTSANLYWAPTFFLTTTWHQITGTRRFLTFLIGRKFRLASTKTLSQNVSPTSIVLTKPATLSINFLIVIQTSPLHLSLQRKSNTEFTTIFRRTAVLSNPRSENLIRRNWKLPSRSSKNSWP